MTVSSLVAERPRVTVTYAIQVADGSRGGGLREGELAFRPLSTLLAAYSSVIREDST